MWNIQKRWSAIGRIVGVNPIKDERYYVCHLVNHIRGPSLFELLNIVGRVMASLFRKAASFYGLLETHDVLVKE